MRRLPVLLLLGGVAAGAGATALAQAGDPRSPYDLPEPDVTSRQVLHLPSPARCLEDTLVTVRITPPPGAVLGWLHVHVNRRARVQLTGVPRAASATVGLSHRRPGRVTVDGETLGGQRLRVSHVYRACDEHAGNRTPTPSRPTPGPIPVAGGGTS